MVDGNLDYAKDGGLVPAVVQCWSSARVISLGHLSPESFRLTKARKKLYLCSTQTRGIEERLAHCLPWQFFVDCDRDAVVFQVYGADSKDVSFVERVGNEAPAFGSGVQRLRPCVITGNSRVTGQTEVLMLGYQDREAWEQTLKTGRVHFWSRKRKGLWLKGEESGNFFLVRRISLSTRDDAVLINVNVAGNGLACHHGRRSCFVLEN